jgi:hypothetical protein
VQGLLLGASVAQQPQQLPVPNIVILQAAVDGMAAKRNTIVQSVQAYNAHQQQLNTELNNEPAQMLQQSNALTQSIHNLQATMNAQ